jgi:hypothetical protein
MDLLLDTHAFIWFVENDKQLPTKTKNEIEKEVNTPPGPRLFQRGLYGIRISNACI